jgi:hypothetical protein
MPVQPVWKALPRQFSATQQVKHKQKNLNKQLKPIMKKTVICVFIVNVLTAAANAQNANVNWQTPTPIFGPSDVNTSGTYFASWAPYNQDSYNNGANGLVVNGVAFLAQTDLPDLSYLNFNSGYTSYNDPGTSDANYNDLMQSAAYNGNGDGSPLSLTWGGMTPGDTYLVQFWANDGRGNDRSETFTGGADTSASLVFGNNPGEYIIGTFVADTTGSETISMSGVGSVNGPYPQMNLMQVRDISAVPEPSTFAFVAVSVGAMLCGVRRKLLVG